MCCLVSCSQKQNKKIEHQLETKGKLLQCRSCVDLFKYDYKPDVVLHVWNPSSPEHRGKRITGSVPLGKIRGTLLHYE